MNTIFHGGHYKIMFRSDAGYSTYNLVPKYRIETLYPGGAPWPNSGASTWKKRCAHISTQGGSYSGTVLRHQCEHSLIDRGEECHQNLFHNSMEPMILVIILVAMDFGGF